MSEQEYNLRLLDDLPVEKTADFFHHEIYASIIQDVFLSNKPGLSVGLFGKWGQGKSSIVHALKEGLKGKATVVVFNAWKASGDSVRRQLILDILKTIAPDRAKELKRFVGLEVVESVLLTEKEARKKKTLAKIRTFLDFGLWLKLSWLFLLAGGLFVIGFVLAVLALTEFRERGEFWMEWAMTVFFPAGVFLTLYVVNTVKQRYYGRLSISQPLSESQKLQYPEQFQEVLEKYVRAFCKDNGRLIVVVDDLDRCNAETVAEALAAIRQFTADQIDNPYEFNCQFLIPCDEQQVVLALESAGHDAGIRGARYHDYQSEELLRKFFDAVVRMDEMLPDDLSDFAADLAGQIGLEEKDARELIDIAGARDPRQIKKLLNALKVSHESVDRRAGKLLAQKGQMVELAATQRLLVALRETVPEAYKRVVTNPEYVKGIPQPKPDTALEEADEPAEQERRAEDQITKANEIIGRAGSVSEVTAMQLIYGRLDPELRPVSTGGLLTNALMTWDEKGFSEGLTASRKEDLDSIRNWLQKKILQAKSDAATKDILRLMLGFAESEHEGAPETISPCIDTLFSKTASLPNVFSGFKRYQALEIVWPHIASEGRRNAIAAIYANFEKDSAKANPELSFLLEHAQELESPISTGLRAWMLEEAKAEKDDEAFVRRINVFLRSEKGHEACRGFAPEVAVVIAGKSEWLDDADAEEDRDPIIQMPGEWPRFNVVTTLLGDSQDHAVRCLGALFEDNGQLARPQALSGRSPGLEPAWRAVGRLLSIVSAEQLQNIFENIQNWLQQQSGSDSLESILSEIGDDVCRLSENQIAWCGQFLSKRLQSHTADLYIMDFIGKNPDKEALKTGWKQLVDSFVKTCFTWLQGQPALSQQMNDSLAKMYQLGWAISEAAENLLIQKLQTPNVSAFYPWLNALAPLVANRRTNLRDAVKGCIEQNQRVKQALAVGMTILWKNEIDVEPASTLGAFFIEHQSDIPQHSAEWDRLRDIPGANRVLETMRKQLPSEAATLVSYRHALEMIASDFDKLTKRESETFIDEKIRLLFIEDATALQMGISIANQLSSISKRLQKQLKELQMRDNISQAHKKAIGEILNKDTL